MFTFFVQINEEKMKSYQLDVLVFS